MTEARSLGPDPGDRALLAASQSRILITIDTDFGELVFLEKQRHCGIIRLPDVVAHRRIQLLADVLERHSGDLEAGTRQSDAHLPAASVIPPRPDLQWVVL